MYPYRPSQFLSQLPYQRSFPPMMMQPSRMSMGPVTNQPRGLGGLFSKLLGGGNPSSTIPFQGMSGMGVPPGMSGFYPQAGTGTSGLAGMLKNSFSSAGGLTGMLDNVQRVMGVAQQFGPMVQQYGPFIKNMPAMLKIMREINSSEVDTEETTESTAETELPEKELPTFETESPPKETKPIQGLSTPKLFI